MFANSLKRQRPEDEIQLIRLKHYRRLGTDLVARAVFDCCGGAELAKEYNQQVLAFFRKVEEARECTHQPEGTHEHNEALERLLEAIVERIRPLVQVRHQSQTAVEQLKQILKAYNCLDTTPLPQALLSSSSYRKWLSLLVDIIINDTVYVPLGHDDEWCEVVERALDIFLRSCPARLGRSKTGRSEWFLAHCPVLTICKKLSEHLIEGYMKTEWLAARLSYFMQHALAEQSSKTAKKFLVKLFKREVRPRLYLLSSHDALWLNNAPEYVRQDFYLNSYTSTFKRCSLLLSIMSSSASGDYLVQMALRAATKAQTGRDQDRALHIIGCLASNHRFQKQLTKHVEHLFRLAHDPNPILRARLWWTMSKLGPVSVGPLLRRRLDRLARRCLQREPEQLVREEAAMYVIGCSGRYPAQVIRPLCGLLFTSLRPEMVSLLEKRYKSHDPKLSKCLSRLLPALFGTAIDQLEKAGFRAQQVTTMGRLLTLIANWVKSLPRPTYFGPKMAQIVIAICERYPGQLYCEAAKYVLQLDANHYDLGKITLSLCAGLKSTLADELACTGLKPSLRPIMAVCWLSPLVAIIERTSYQLRQEEVAAILEMCDYLLDKSQLKANYDVSLIEILDRLLQTISEPELYAPTVFRLVFNNMFQTKPISRELEVVSMGALRRAFTLDFVPLKNALREIPNPNFLERMFIDLPLANTDASWSEASRDIEALCRLIHVGHLFRPVAPVRKMAPKLLKVVFSLFQRTKARLARPDPFWEHQLPIPFDAHRLVAKFKACMRSAYHNQPWVTFLTCLLSPEWRTLLRHWSLS